MVVLRIKFTNTFQSLKTVLGHSIQEMSAAVIIIITIISYYFYLLTLEQNSVQLIKEASV